MKRTEREKIVDTMKNVMAALNGFGVEYSTNWYGYSSETSLKEIQKIGDGDTKDVFFEDFDGGDEFKKEFKKFVERKNCSKVQARAWAEEENMIMIQICRQYEDMYDDYYEAMENEWNSSPSYLTMNVHIYKTSLRNFVSVCAPYCW